MKTHFDLKKKLFKIRSYLVAQIGKGLTHLLIKTCKIEIDGLENFIHLAQSEKCLLMLWHNRVAITPYILSQFTPQISYAALVSGSKDGDILRYWIHSYKNGKTIQVPHLGRYEALREVIRQVEERKKIVIITPDGPRGPKYEIKPGIVVAAIETQAYIVPLEWKAKRFWELKTWDRLRLPKPFTTIQISFQHPINLFQNPLSLEEAKMILKNQLPKA